jgi:dihydropyrimidinase
MGCTEGPAGAGRDADIVLFDPAATRRLSAAVLHSDIDHSTYDGQDVRGWPVRHDQPRSG